VHSASDRLNRHQSQLDTLLSTLQLMQDKHELQTSQIEKQVQKIITLGEALQRQLNAFAAQLARSKPRQYTHAIISSDKDKRDLKTAFIQLD
jgi:RNA polymerase-interacting CarD/CdnL/TRCF family regulator